MLRIYYRNSFNEIMYIDWKPGTPSPFKDAPEMVWNVGEVQASGEARTWIDVKFDNLPKFNDGPSHVIRYFGDLAKFIAGNLP